MIAEGCRRSIVGCDAIESAASTSAESLTDDERRPFQFTFQFTFRGTFQMPFRHWKGDCWLWDVL